MRIYVKCFLLVAVVGLVASGCAADAGQDAGAGASPTRTRSVNDHAEHAVESSEIRIKDFEFDPSTARVAVGDVVTWENEDFFGHTVTSGTPDESSDAFDGVMGEVADAEGTTFSHTFDEAGTYPYFCRFHPTMLGTVVVKE